MKNIIPKEEQKQHLIDIMRGDEELGLYEEPKQEEDEIIDISDHDGIGNAVDNLNNTPPQETLEEDKLRQLFKNRSNCYADTGRFENDGSYSEGEVIQAMDENCFINVIKEWQQERMYSEEEVKEFLHKIVFDILHKKEWFGTEEWFEKFKKK